MKKTKLTKNELLTIMQGLRAIKTYDKVEHGLDIMKAAVRLGKLSKEVEEVIELIDDEFKTNDLVNLGKEVSGLAGMDSKKFSEDERSLVIKYNAAQAEFNTKTADKRKPLLKEVVEVELCTITEEEYKELFLKGKNLDVPSYSRELILEYFVLNQEVTFSKTK